MQKIIEKFWGYQTTKLRGCPLMVLGCGVKHRKVTYEHRGMYWSIERGLHYMARMILLERIDQLYELFSGIGRNEYEN